MREERPTPQLSPREVQLLDFAAAGMTDTAIARELGISEATVGTYWGRVRIKMGPYSRTELVALRMRAQNEAEVEALREENERLAGKLKEEQAAPNGASYRELLEYAPDAIIVVASNGVIDYANAAALELFGYRERELEGMDLLSLIPERYRVAHAGHRQGYFEHPDRREMGEHLETPALRKDGTEFLIRAALSGLTTLTSTSVICAIRKVPK